MTQATLALRLQSLVSQVGERQAYYLRQLAWIHANDDGVVTLGLPNRIMVDSFVRNLRDMVQSELSDEFGPVELTIVCSPDATPLLSQTHTADLPTTLPGAPADPGIAFSPKPRALPDLKLDPSMSFERFRAGQINRVAFAAAQQAAYDPGGSVNPLFLYGGVGLGKTHLMNAVGQVCQRQGPNFGIVYVTSERFLNDYTRALQESKMADFRNKYRRCQLLMIDDIQFMETWEKTQDELFNIFNQLHASGAQMIFTSDRPPSKLQRFTDRLISRMAGGLVIELKQPDQALRQEILTSMFQDKQVVLPESVVQTIAELVSGSVRLIQSVVNKLHFYAQYEEPDQWTADHIRSLIADILPLEQQATASDGPITFSDIIDLVCHRFGVQRDDLLSHGRTRNVVRARQVAMTLCRELTPLSLAELGKLFGGKNHTTVMKAVQRLYALKKEEPELAAILDDLHYELTGQSR